MVSFRYEKWDEEWLDGAKRFASLMALFHHLLLQANGDVERVLQFLRQQQMLGRIPDDVDLAAFEQSLEEGRLISLKDGLPKLTPSGERFLRRESLNQIFGNLKRGPFGQHRTPHSGDGGEKLPETRPWRFGDELRNIDFQRTLHNTLVRGGLELRLAEDDFELHETEHATSCATVLMVDVSHSMVLYGEDRITPAKKVALALAELIQTRYPKDSLNVVLFGDDAKEVRVGDLPYVGAGPFHTNTRAGLQLAQRILRRRKHPNKQIFMITDGKASAITEHGRLYKNPFSMDPKIVNMTLDEAAIARRNKIVITTFMLTKEPALVDFVNKLTRVNRGRAYFSSVDNLGESIFVDYIRNRKRRIR